LGALAVPEDAEGRPEDAEAEGAEGTRGLQVRLGLQVRRGADSVEVVAVRLPLATPMLRSRRRSKVAAGPSPRQEPIA